MAKIKSALEIALARTEGVQSDKGKLLEHDAKQEGKRIASKFLNEPNGGDTDIRKKIQSYDGNKQKWIREGIVQTIISNISLPHQEEDLDRLSLIEKALIETLGEKKQLSGMFQQLKQFFTQYLENKEQLFEHLEQQYAPKLQQKTRELSSQMGSEVVLDIHSDPEFLNLLKQNQSRLDEQFQEAMDGFKQQISSFAKAKG